MELGKAHGRGAARPSVLPVAAACGIMLVVIAACLRGPRAAPAPASALLATMGPPPATAAGWLRSCSAFAHMPPAACGAAAMKACSPGSTYLWMARPMQRGGCARVGDYEVCAHDVAILVMTSKATAARIAASMETWVPAAARLGMGVIVAVASQEGADAVLRDAQTAPVEALGVEEQTSHAGFSHVRAALRRLADRFPGRKWYMKVDDDAFVYPTNLLHFLAYQQGDPAALVGYGNTLIERSPFFSGGAGYVLSQASMARLVQQPSDACWDAIPSEWNEDMAVSDCLAKMQHTFVGGAGFYMCPPDQAFTHWRRHHWDGEVRYPITFHWLKAALPKLCLACGCVEVDGDA